jgi:hypothetical protein
MASHEKKHNKNNNTRSRTTLAEIGKSVLIFQGGTKRTLNTCFSIQNETNLCFLLPSSKRTSINRITHCDANIGVVGVVLVWNLKKKKKKKKNVRETKKKGREMRQWFRFLIYY